MKLKYLQRTVFERYKVLQGSQTYPMATAYTAGFERYKVLQGSQTRAIAGDVSGRLRDIKFYKALKLGVPTKVDGIV